MDGLRCVDADKADALAGAKQQSVSVDDSLNVFKLARCYAWVWWIEESGEKRNKDESRQGPFPPTTGRCLTKIHCGRILHVCGEGVKANL
jgi:hypothetical protein